MSHFRGSNLFLPLPQRREQEQHRQEFAYSTFENNQRGLANGITLFVLASLALVLFYLFSPSWLTLRTDVEESQCWRSDGILRMNVHSGHSALCAQTRNHHGAINESSSFCDADPTSALCTSTQLAMICSSMNIAVLLASLLIQSTSCASKFTDVLCIVLLMTLVSASLGMATLYIMFSSPLYSLDYLSKIGQESGTHDPHPFDGFASCAIESPFASVSALFSSAALRCVFPGEAAFMAIIQVCAALIASAFTGLSIRQQHRKKTQVKPWSTIPTPSASAIRENSAKEIELEFSIFSEFNRKLKAHNLGPLQRFALLSFLPCLLVTIHAVTWLAYLLNGIQILTGITVEYHNHEEHVTTLYRQVLNMFNFSPVTTTGFFWSADAKLIAVFSFAAIVVLPGLKLLTWVHFLFVPAPASFRSRMLFLADISGKFQMANLYVLTFTGVAMSFHRRIAIPFGDDNDALMIPWPWNHNDGHYSFPHILIDIRTAMNPGFGSWMFEVTFIISLLIGQIICMANTYAGGWHEQAKKCETGSDGRLEYGMDTPTSGGPPRLGRRYTRSFSDVEDYCEAVREQQQHAAAVSPRQSQALRHHNTMDSTESVHSQLLMNVTRHSTLESISENLQSPPLPVSASGRRLRRNSRLSIISDNGRALPPQSVGTSNNGMHPYAQSLSDRTIYPEKGVRLKFTLRGKIVMLCLIFLVGCLLLICQGMTIFHIHMNGLLGFMREPSDPSELSLLSIVSTLYGKVKWSDSNSLAISLLFFVTTCFVPFIRVFGMAMLWTLPLTLQQERRLFRMLEMVSAWSSLDVFLLSLIVMCLQMKSSTEQLITDFIPNASQLLKDVLPFDMGNIYADIHPVAAGFTVLTIAVVMDKFLAHIIFEQAVASISERLADESLNEVVVELNTPVFHTATSPGGIHGITEDDEDEESATFSQTRQEPLPSEDEIIDAAESILGTNAVAYFGPVERYLSALMPSKMYAGFPRHAWTSVGKRLGLVDDADVVVCYNEFGIAPSSLLSSEEGEQMLEDEAVALMASPVFHHATNNQYVRQA